MTNGASVEGEIGGQKFKYSGPVNTMFTVLAFVGVVGTGVAVYDIRATVIQHQADSRTGMGEFVSALKEQTKALREQTCLMRFPEGERQRQTEQCKQLSQI